MYVSARQLYQQDIIRIKNDEVVDKLTNKLVD